MLNSILSKSLQTLALASLVGLLAVSVGGGGDLRAAVISWNLASGGNWDFTTPNWTGDDTVYSDNDNVTFSNPAGGVISISSNVAPAVTNVDAPNGTTYTFFGANITSGNLTKSGAGVMELGVAHTAVNPTVTISGGTLRLLGHNLLSSTTLRAGSGALDMNGFDQTIRATSNGQVHFINMGNLTINGPGGGDIHLGSTFSGSGSLTFGPSIGNIPFGSTATYTGGTFIHGTLVGLYQQDGGQFPATGQVTVGPTGTFSLNWHNTPDRTKTIGALNGSGAVLSSGSNVLSSTVNTANTTFRLGNGGGDGVFDGVFSGPGSLVKLGDGTQVFNGDNTYTGTTTVSAGTLVMNGVNGPDQGSYTVESGAVLRGVGTLNLASGNGVTIETGGVLALHGGTLTINGDLTFEDDAIFNVQGALAGAPLLVNGLITLDGSVTLDIAGMSGEFVLLDWTNGSTSGWDVSNFNILEGLNYGMLEIVGSQLLLVSIPVPEPGTLALVGLGLAGLSSFARRRRRRTGETVSRQTDSTCASKE